MKTNTAKTLKPKSKSATRKATPKQTKAAKILTLLRRPSGASIDELCKITGWQAHSVRGFMSGTVKKRLGQDVVSKADDNGVRRYRIETEKPKANT